MPTIRELFKQKFEEDKFDGILAIKESIAEIEKRIMKAAQNQQWNWVTHYSKNLEDEQNKLQHYRESLRFSLMILQKIEESD